MNNRNNAAIVQYRTVWAFTILPAILVPVLVLVRVYTSWAIRVARQPSYEYDQYEYYSYSTVPYFVFKIGTTVRYLAVPS